MAKLARKTAVLFAANNVSAPSGLLAVFGSKAAGSIAYSADPNVIQSLTQWLAGWSSAVTGTQQPNRQDVNALDYVLSYFICNLAERGVLDFDVNGGGTAAATVYNLGSIVNDGTGALFVSQKDNNTSLLSNTNDWYPLLQTLKGPGLYLAQVVYDSVNDTLLSGYNVLGVTKIATGVFDVYFRVGWMPSIYGFSGSCGTQDGVNAVGGDNNLVCGGNGGSPGIRNQTKARIYLWDANVAGSGLLEDSGCVTVNFA